MVQTRTPRHLPDCIEKPSDIEARAQMQLASTMAGWAFSVAGVGLVHGMSHALGARHRVPHGTANGILLPHVMRFNTDSAPAKLALVARALGVPDTGAEPELAQHAADAVSALLTRLGHPVRLAEVGLAAKDFPACAALALNDGATSTNPRPLRSAQEIVAVYGQAL
jgi:aldehyde dehydrogenase (NAD+)